MKTDLMAPFFETIDGMFAAIRERELPAIREAGGYMADAIAQGGLVHVFGSGHSELIAREIVGRAGGLVPINEIVDGTLGRGERVEGYAAELLTGYDLQYELRAGEVLIVISNSGINPLPIEAAQFAKARGLRVVAITNRAQSEAATSRHSSGQRLFEVADVVIDTHGVAGDAIVPVPGMEARVGAGSTLAGALVVNLMALAAVEALLARGVEPPLLVSQNLPGTDARNEALWARYRGRLRQSGA
jgi:uncharacterized phosphosugar-binding protein